VVNFGLQGQTRVNESRESSGNSALVFSLR